MNIEDIEAGLRGARREVELIVNELIVKGKQAIIDAGVDTERGFQYDGCGCVFSELKCNDTGLEVVCGGKHDMQYLTLKEYIDIMTNNQGIR